MERVSCELLFGEWLNLKKRTGLLKTLFSPSIWAGHDAEGCEGRDAEYMASRRPHGKEWTKMVNDIDILWYQRNYLKCVVDL